MRRRLALGFEAAAGYNPLLMKASDFAIDKTRHLRPAEIRREWLLFDADGRTLGRLAAAVAHRLAGKHKPVYSPHLDVGDFVVIVNADKVRLTGNKETDKLYRRHSGYPGGLREQSAARLRARHPDRLLRFAVKGMLPKNTRGRTMIRKLKIYAGGEHPHGAQGARPVALD